jgi:hypothetical protein
MHCCVPLYPVEAAILAHCAASIRCGFLADFQTLLGADGFYEWVLRIPGHVNTDSGAM